MSWKADAFEDGDSDYTDEETEHMEVVEPPQPKRRNKGKANNMTTQQNQKKACRRHVLNKEEKLSVTTHMHILALKGEEITMKGSSDAIKQLAPVSNSLKQFSEST